MVLLIWGLYAGLKDQNPETGAFALTLPKLDLGC